MNSTCAFFLAVSAACPSLRATQPPATSPQAARSAPATAAPSRAESATDDARLRSFRRDVLAFQSKLYANDATPGEVLDFLDRALGSIDVLSAENKGAVEASNVSWITLESFQDEELGAVDLTVGPAAGTSGAAHQVTLVVRSNKAGYLPHDLDLVDSVFRIYVGLGETGVTYCASSVHARVHSTQRVKDYLTAREPIRIGATYQFRQGEEKRSEIVARLDEVFGAQAVQTSFNKLGTQTGLKLEEVPSQFSVHQRLSAMLGIQPR